MMLALAHTLVVEGLVDLDFVIRACAGYDEFAAYLLGTPDGVVKDAGVGGADLRDPRRPIRALARKMAAGRTLVTVTWSLQRTEFGEQPVWAGLALGALLGQIGLPGGGFGHGYGSMADVGTTGPAVRAAEPAAGPQPGAHLHPGGPHHRPPAPPGRDVRLRRRARYTYPDTRLVYWAGGNPFHHHQDLNRLRGGLTRPDTVIVHEPYWTPMARHADIVFPSTVALERDDFGGGRRDSHLIAMHAAVAPFGEARDDHAILAGLADRMGVGEAFTEGRTTMEWLEHLYEKWRGRLADRGVALVPFDRFWADGGVELPAEDDDRTTFAAFRADPDARPLHTPSGRIELASPEIAGFGYDDCPGHPTWLAPTDDAVADRFPLQLIANQPTTRLHSQLDMGALSQASKIAGPRADAHPPRRRRRPRHRRRRRGAGVQRPGHVPGRRSRHRRRAARRGAAVHRGVVRPVRPPRLRPDVRPRQPQRAHRRPAHVTPVAGVRRPAHEGGDRPLRRRAAADHGAGAAAVRSEMIEREGGGEATGGGHDEGGQGVEALVRQSYGRPLHGHGEAGHAPLVEHGRAHGAHAEVTLLVVQRPAPLPR